LNADIIARGINPNRPEDVSIAAGRQIIVELAKTLRARESFVYETTLSSNQSIAVMRAAKRAGYEVGLVFVTLNSADLNVERVAWRAARGGHDIPEHVVRRRYGSTLRRLPQAIGLSDGSMIFDNSTATGPYLLAQIQAGSIEVNNLDEAVSFHCRLAEAVAEALSLSIDAVFQAAKPS
jgi:predicted ABC-type ATPase